MASDPSENSTAAASSPEDGDSLAMGTRANSRRGFPPGSRFQHITFLGEGGMGRVYRADDPLLGRTVALKLAHSDSDIAMMRFTAEAQAQARIDHPNVAKVFEVGEVQGSPFIVMQFVDGPDLAQAHSKLSLEQLARIMRQVAGGVEAAHRLGLLHRDLKPQNILIEGAESTLPHPYVTDFGLVKDLDSKGLTETGTALGTPRYMSPELVQGRSGLVDARADVYALGATMYEVFGGGPVYGDISDVDLLFRIMKEDPHPLSRAAPSVPEDLALIVQTCMAREPGRRYPSAQALAEDLDRYLQAQPIWARRPTLGYRLRRGLARHRNLAALGGLALLALLALGTWSFASLSRSRRQAQLAADFGQRAQAMETQLRLAFMAPPHPIQPQIDAVSLEMTRLEEDMRKSGPIAVGPGNWALGEGHMALGQTDRAMSCLDKAWAAGFQTPASAFTRGRILLQEFVDGSEGLYLIQDEKRRQDELARLETRFKRPALDMLHRARALPGAGALLAANISFLEGREDDALRECEAALLAEPWRFEACIIQIKIWVGREQKAISLGNAGLAAEARMRMEQAFDRAHTIAPSHPILWMLHGTGWLDRSKGKTAFIVLQPAEELHHAISDYDHALALSPLWVSAFNNRSEAQCRLAAISQMKGEDPGAWIQRAIEDADSSLRINSDQPRAHVALARALALKADAMVDSGQEAGAELDRCVSSLAKAKPFVLSSGAVEDAESFDVQEVMSFGMKGQNDMHHGRDGRPSFRNAIASVQRLLLRDPHAMRTIGINSNLGMQLADAEDRLGGDPSPMLQSAQAGFEQILKTAPNNVQVLSDCAEVHRIRASHLVKLKQDPGPELDQAEKLIAQGLKLAPQFHELYQAEGRTALVAARWKRVNGRSETKSLALARTSMRRAKALNPRLAELDEDLRELKAFESHS